MRAQYRIDNELDRARLDEIEKLKKGIEKPITKKGEKKEVVKRKKSAVKQQPKPKVEKKADKFEKDFFEGEEN